MNKINQSYLVILKGKFTDKEDDSVQPVVAECEGDDEERDSQEHGDAGDDVDEVMDLLGDGGLSGVQARGEPGNTTHHGVVSTADHYSLGGTCNHHHG